MVLFTFYRHSTCIFQNRNIEESFSRDAHRNYSPFGGKHGIHSRLPYFANSTNKFQQPVLSRVVSLNPGSKSSLQMLYSLRAIEKGQRKSFIFSSLLFYTEENKSFGGVKLKILQPLETLYSYILP